MRASATLLLTLTVAPPAAAQQDVMQMRTEPLGPGLTVISGFANGNILALTGPDGTLLVDAQSARRVGLADSVLAVLGAPPVRWIINTHYHRDHTEGNAFFRSRGAEVIGQANLPPQMRKDTTITSLQDWHRTPADPAAIPTRTFRDSLVLDANGQRVVVIHVPTAHTDGDAIVWLPAANVMHVGDLFEHLAPAFLDWWAGGTVAGMVAGVDWALAHSDGATRIVPGHGPVGTRDDLLRYRQMMLGVATAVAVQVRAGASLDATQALQPAAPWLGLLGSQRRAEQFVALLYLGLKEFEPASSAARLAAGTAEARLPWLIGCWQGTTEKSAIEERWVVQPDGTLQGIGRIRRGGTVVNEERVTISAQGGTVAYTVRADGAAPVTFTSVAVTDSSVTFANPAHDFPTRVAYRQGGGARLLAEIAGPGKDGEVVVPFTYAAAVCQGD